MRKIQKTILSLICGVSLAVPACYDSGRRAGSQDRTDAATDPIEEVEEDLIEDVDEEEEPSEVDMYGPPIDAMYGPPYP